MARLTIESKGTPRLTVAGLGKLVELEAKQKDHRQAGRTLSLDEKVSLGKLRTARQFTNLNAMKKKQRNVRTQNPPKRKLLNRKP